jgi:PhnB protein
MHAEIMVGNSPVMLADANPEWGMQSPPALGGTPVTLAVYVENVDEVFQRAINAGGEQVRPVEDQFYGDRTGTLRDPFGHVWTIATHTEDLEPTEIEKRFEEMMANQKSG